VPTRTAVLVVHGGGWILGDRSMMESLASRFAAEGFLAIAVEYRLVREAPWPAQLNDVISAVRWTADNAERLGIDRGRIVVAGSSAGGQLAMLAAAALRKEPRVAAVISLFSASELTVDSKPAKGHLDASALLGSQATEEAVRAASPLYQITADYPPVFLLHGGADWLIDPVASLRVYERLVGLGVPAELHIVARALHEFVGEPGMTGPMVSEIALFLNRILIDPERWVAESQASNIFAQGPEVMKAMMAQMAEQMKGSGSA
jgi:acetyl esterase/lipase